MPIIVSRAPSGRGLVLRDRNTRQSVMIPINELLTIGSALIQEAEMHDGPAHPIKPKPNL